MLKLVTLRARPELRPQLFSEPLQAVWPEFMQHDPNGGTFTSTGPISTNIWIRRSPSSIPPNPTSLSGGHLPCRSCSGTCPSGWSCRTPAGTA